MTVQRYDPPTNPALLDRSTDSWTAVLADVVDLANNIARTEFVPAGLRGSTEKVVAAILHGRELGLPPMTALAHTSVINGRPGTSAEAQRGLVQQAGHQIRITESSDTRCTIRGRRSDWPTDEWTTVTFTIEDAVKRGLLADRRTSSGKVIPSMYKLWPAEMLLARASTRLTRMVFSDVIHGMRSSEELQDMDLEGEYEPPAPAPTVQVSRSVGRAPVESEAPSLGGTAEASAEEVGAAGSEQQPAAAPASARRRRPPLTKRHLTPAPAPAPEPEPEPEPTLPDQSEPVVDAEIVDDPSQPVEETSAEWRQKTIVVTQMHWERLLGQPVDREERLWWTGIITGRPVSSAKDLTDVELEKLVKILSRLKNRGQVEALAAATDGGE